MKKWKMRPNNPEESAKLARESGNAPFCCDILWGRGHQTLADMADFFDTSCRLSDPLRLIDMDKAVARIHRALDEGEKIAVYGDYDCDGITSTVMLYHYLEAVGGDVIYHIPDRHEEGYGLNADAVRLMAAHHIQLIITVDNGISAIDEVTLANSLGIDVVVTDHHKPRQTLPPAVAVVDPHRADCPSGCVNLSGVGVAFKLICALQEDDGTEMLSHYSDLITIGTLADVVPISGENRAMVQNGLQKLQNPERVGLVALFEVAGLADKTITSESVIYGLCPRINATGRLGDVGEAVELLLCEDEERAAQLAKELNALNMRRKSIESEIMEEINRMIEGTPQLVQDRLIILCGNGWHHGVIGIVAARILEQYDKPCLILSCADGEARGSARSIEGFSIIEAISQCSKYLQRYGGHPQAAGITLAVSDVPEFAAALQAYAAASHPDMPFPEYPIDRIVIPREITLENAAALQALEPFGEGNPQPVFVLQNMLLETLTPIGEGKYLRLGLRSAVSADDNNLVTAVCFEYSPQTIPFSTGDRVDVAISLGTQLYNGEVRVNIKETAMRLSGLDEEAFGQGERQYDRYLRGELSAQEKTEVAPTRDDIALLYRFLVGSGGYPFGLSQLSARMLLRGLSYPKTRIGIEVLLELGLITLTYNKGSMVVSVVPNPQKTDISTSKTLAVLTGAKLVN